MDACGNVKPTRSTEAILRASASTVFENSSWTSLGPDGGDVVDVAIDPLNTSRIFAVTGIPYFSDDAGENWYVLDGLSSISSGEITSIEINNNGVMLAGGLYNSGIVFRSDDEGNSWTTHYIPLNRYIYDITFDPNNQNIAYLGMSTSTTSSADLLKSSDAGLSWTVIDLESVLEDGFTVIDVLVDPDNSQNIYAICFASLSMSSKIIASFDGGDNWTNITGSLPTNRFFNQLAIADGNLFLAGGHKFSGLYLGVYKTQDNGANWDNISITFPEKVSNCILIDPLDHNKIYVGSGGDGVYFTNDGGASWNFNCSGVTETGTLECLAFDPENSQIIYAGLKSFAVCKSTDASLNWEYANKGIASLTLTDIEVNTLNTEMILASYEAENSGGCYLSNDGGNSWENINSLPTTRYSQVAFGSDGTMYAISSGPSNIADEGLYKSIDGGNTWESLGPNFSPYMDTQIRALRTSASNPDLLFIGGNNYAYQGKESIIYRSVDGGMNWEETYRGLEYERFVFLHIDPNSDDQIIYSAYRSYSRGGFLKSIDEGVTWMPINLGIPAGVRSYSAIISDPQNSDILYGGVGGYYSGEVGLLYSSDNAGVSWEFANLDFNSACCIIDIVISPNNSGVIYLATTQKGVYLSTDTASSWNPYNEGLPATKLTGFSKPFLKNNVWQLCASTYTNSAYIADVFIPDPVDILVFPEQDVEFNIYPNPSAGMFMIYSKRTISEQLEVSLIDSQGNVVYRSSQYIGANNEIRIDLDLSPGLYFLRMIHQGKIHARKLLVI